MYPIFAPFDAFEFSTIEKLLSELFLLKSSASIFVGILNVFGV